jgi:hypothetical protein
MLNIMSHYRQELVITSVRWLCTGFVDVEDLSLSLSLILLLASFYLADTPLLMPRRSLRTMRLPRHGQSSDELSNADIDDTDGTRRAEPLAPRLIRDISDVQPLKHIPDKVVIYRNGLQIEEPRVWISQTARAHWAEGHGHRYGFVCTNKSRPRFPNAPDLPVLEQSTHSVELKMSSFVESELGAGRVLLYFSNLSNYTS